MRILVKPEVLITALSLTLRISEQRFISLSNYSLLAQEQAQYDKLIMIEPSYFYEIVITPNTSNDNPTPSYYAQLLKLKNVTDLLQSLLPQFDLSIPIDQKEVRQTQPLVQIQPYIVEITYYSVSLTMRLHDQGKVFAVIAETN